MTLRRLGRSGRLVSIALVLATSACTALLGSFEVGDGPATLGNDAASSDVVVVDGQVVADGGSDACAVSCNGTCTDLARDDLNCGACGHACGAAEGKCFGGQCGGGDIVRVAGGNAHACALTARGFVFCWGSNERGTIGQGTDVTCDGVPCQPVPRRVVGIETASAISATTHASCVVSEQGKTIQCWGGNESGELGHAPDAAVDEQCFQQRLCAKTPAAVPNVTAQRELGHTAATFCAYPKNVPGELWCWGNASLGLLGPVGDGGPMASPPVKIQVPSFPGAEVMTMDGTRHACATFANQRTLCWGRNAASELGHQVLTMGDVQRPIDTFNTTPLDPQDTGGKPVEKITQVVATDGSTCALMADSTVMCWGYAGYGVVGNVATLPPHVARPIPQLNGVVSLAASLHAVCARLRDDRVMCWGLNEYGQLGRGFVGRQADAGAGPCGANLPCYDLPAEVPGLKVRAIAGSGGGDFFVAIGTDGKVKVWGANSRGQLGHPPNAKGDVACANGAPCSPSPVDVDSLPTR